MGPERKLYQKIKKNITSISWIRLENLSSSGTPDLLGYNTSGHFFTIELKVTKSNKVRFSPHQIAFHVKHPKNSFICIEHLGSGCVKLFPGSGILALEACCLGPGPGRTLVASVEASLLMAWSVAEAAMPSTIFCSSLLRASLRKFL